MTDKIAIASAISILIESGLEVCSENDKRIFPSYGKFTVKEPWRSCKTFEKSTDAVEEFLIDLEINKEGMV